ncbi:MAG: VWA domain-containing protein, partial [Planctomycetes bacterium]|nr:VWA domain-containing protein [Planctomycetota bacterium]
MMPFRFGTPAALMLLLLLPALFIIARRSLAGLPTFRRRLALALRTALLLILIFALADMQWVKFGKDLTVFFILDQSRSIPPGSRNEAITYVNNAVKRAREHDRAGLILFGSDAGLEKFPQSISSGKAWFRKSSLVLNRERTDLAGAVRLALAAFPENSRKRIVMLTDGCENKGLVLGQADVARSLQCPIDVMMVDYEHSREVLLEKALAPPRLRAGEPFELRIVVKALQDCDAKLTLTIDGRPSETGRPVSLRKGKEVMSFGFPEGLAQSGPYTFEATIRSPADTILENNSAVAYTWVEGKARKVLLIDSKPDDLSYLVEALAAEDINTIVKGPASMPTSMTELRRYDCLVLSNVGAGHFAPEQLGMIEGAVKELGMGLVLIGGERSFGAGGYRETPIEDCSPVDFDIRQKRVMPKGAIVLAMDAAEDPDGNRWAIEMAAASLNVLSYHDDIAIYAGGWHLPLREVQDKVAVRVAIDKLQVPDDNEYSGQLRAALAALKQSSAASKHVLIMTDGGHGQYNLPKPLMKALREARISVTVVLFHPHSDSEKVVINSLTNLAMTTGGRFYYPKTAKELPMIFFKEATMITRSLIHEEAFSPILQQATDPVHGFDGLPNLGGYVLTTPKARAQVPIARR